MRLVMIDGGFGNQVFQYIFTRYLEEKTGEACVLDDLFFFSEFIHHEAFKLPLSYELERIFSIRHTRFSELFDSDVIKEMAEYVVPPRVNKYSRGIVSALKSAGMEFFPVQEGNFYQTVVDYKGPIFSVPANGYAPWVADFGGNGNYYYHGYWINGNWFNEIKDTIVKELVFPPLTSEANKAYMSEIESSGIRSVAIHIRRNDFVTMGWALRPEFYQNAITKLRGYIKNPVFFMFSDDIEWVEENQKELGLRPNDNIVIVKGNKDNDSYIDMQLMSACRGMIIANSSFSYLAALLNRRPDKIVINPTQREIF